MENVDYTKQSSTTVNKCPGCGATLEWSVKKQGLACKHCGYVKPLDSEETVQERELTSELLQGHAQWTEAQVYRCEACGVKEVIHKNDLTRICPFCGSTNIVDTNELAGIKPDSVIPFLITKKEGAEHFNKWLKGKWFASNKCKKSAVAEKLNAMYNPVWTFDAKTTSSYSGRLGKTETRTYTSNGQTRTQTTIRWFDVRGDIAANYDDYLVQSGSKITQDTLQKIQPFNPDHYRPYKKEYLSGYVAEHYSRDLATGFNVFTNFVKNDLKYKIMNRHGADQCSTLTINTNYSDKKFKYLLLPIYISCFYYNNKLYNFYMNATNGKITGKYPKSPIKVLFAIFGIAIIVGLFIYGYLFL